MDPKNTANLDPKLKEVYDRVMGTTTGAKPPTPPPSPNPAAQPNMDGLSPLPPTPPPSQPGVTPVPPMSARLDSAGQAPQSPLVPKTNGAALAAPPPPPPSNPAAQPSGMKPTVDYAALAAKYATPLPTIDPNTPIVKAPAVTPSTTAYGVVNNGDTKAKPAETGEKKPGGKKKLLLIVGIPIGILIYTVIWIVVFQVDVMSLLPLPK